MNEAAWISADALDLSRRQAAGAAVLHCGFADDERTVRMREDER